MAIGKALPGINDPGRSAGAPIFILIGSFSPSILHRWMIGSWHVEELPDGSQFCQKKDRFAIT